MKFGKSSHSTKWIALDHLSVVHTDAQRPYNPAWAKKIADEFDPDMFGVITVAPIDGNGTYHVADGQHRIEAVKILTGNAGATKVPCNVFADAGTEERAAQLFNAMNTGRRAVHSIDVYRVRVKAGVEPEASVDRIVRQMGFRVQTGMNTGQIAAPAALNQVYRNYGGDTLKYTLATIKAIWDRSPEGASASIIKGMGMFLHKYGKEINDNRFRGAMQKSYSSPAKLIGVGRSMKEMLRVPAGRAMAEALKNCYNQGRGGQKLK